MEEGGERFSTLHNSKESCLSTLSECLDGLEKIWLEVGIPPEQQITRVKVVYDNMAELMSAMVEEEKEMRRSYVDNVVKCRDECVKLSDELDTTYTEPAEDLTVLKKEKHLRTQVKQLLKEKQEKLKEIMSLRVKEGELCEMLGRIPEYIPGDTVLKPQEISEINTRIGFLTVEKKKREIKLAVAAKHILELWCVLNIKARTDREELIEQGCLESFQLSKENMDWLEHMKNNLEIQLEENKKVHKALMMKLESLWSRIGLSQNEQKLFLDQHTGYSDAVIVKIKEEVHRLEELKLQNLERFIISTRSEMAKYWERMFFSEDDKLLFTPYYSLNIGEHLLELHEIKLETLIKEYKENEDMYKLIRARNAMWSKWEEVECRESDPNRFANRGGNLLKEEKERKKLERDIPKHEETIVKEITKWEKTCDRIFTVFGHTFTDFTNTQKEELQQRKDQMKENKLRLKEEAMQKDLTYGSTPAKTPKRRIAGTQILTPANKRAKTGMTPTATTTPTRAARTPRRIQHKFVHSSLISRSPAVKDKNFPRVEVKVPVPNQKRPDTPIKRPKALPTPEVAPEAEITDSIDSGIVNTFDLDTNNVPNVGYMEFEKELSLPSRELMRSSAVHDTPSKETAVRRSLLQTIDETETQ